ncbi:MAG: ABC transporter substrate-binding protein, partial [Candidatus Deferrimicrobiaceae bacterium]
SFPMRRLGFFLPVAILALLLSSLPSWAGSENAEPIRIGVLAPLSGPFASGGSAFLQAVTLAAEQANAEGGVLGRGVDLVVADTQGRVDIARSEALRLTSQEKVFALVGAYLSEETVGVIEVAAASRSVLIVPVAATAEITDHVRRKYDRYRYVFRVGYSIPQWAGMMADFLGGRGIARYAFVGAGIRWNRELARELRQALARKGIVPVYETFYSPRNPAFEPVAVAVTARSPEFLVLGDPGGNAVEFVKRVREGGAAFPILSVGGALGDARVAATLPLSAPLYVQAAAWKGASAAATRYAEAFERRYGYSPVGYSDTLPYDAATLLFSAIRAAGRTDSDAVVTALENGAFPAIAGTYRFDASHQATWGTPELHGIVIRWETGGARIVYPDSQMR